MPKKTCVKRMIKAMNKQPTQTLLMSIIILVFILVIVQLLRRDPQVEKLDWLKNLFGLGDDTNSSSSSSSTVTCTGNTVLDNGVCKTRTQYCIDKSLVLNGNGTTFRSNDPTSWCADPLDESFRDTTEIGPPVNGYDRSEPYAYPQVLTKRFQLQGTPTLENCKDACNDVATPERLGANCDGFMFYSNAIRGIPDPHYISSNIDAEDKGPKCNLFSVPGGNIDWSFSTNGDRVRYPGHRDLHYMHTYVKNSTAISTANFWDSTEWEEWEQWEDLHGG